MADLLALDACRPPQIATALPQGVSDITTPLVVAAWESCLGAHPDQTFVSYLLEGLRHGFRIGYNYNNQCIPCWSNMKSASENPTVVDDYLRGELLLGRIAIYPSSALHSGSPLQLSPFGVIPKRGQPGKWRLITDLSSPKGHSVNDGIDPSLTSLHYASIDDAVAIIQRLGPGSWLAKLDLKAAYRNVPVHPDDQHLLATCWNNCIYIDKSLPFGLRSAPKIFSAIADAVLWAMHVNGLPWIIHYLDDFLLLAPPNSDLHHQLLQVAIGTCSELGFTAHKLAGPTTCLTFLGVEIDSACGQLRLPTEKLLRLKEELGHWHHRSCCTKRELLSLIGVLAHAARVIKPGRSFTRRLIDLASSVSELHHHLHLRHSAKADIAWWRIFAEDWNGVSFFTPTSPSIAFSSDASGSWGCGAFSPPQWFQLEWPEAWRPLNIAVKELLPIAMAAMLWGPNWSGLHVRCLCDNQAVVFAINRRSVRDSDMMRLIRCLFFIEATHKFSLSASHLPGRLNTAADCLSRNKMSEFFRLFPQVQSFPVTIPHEVSSLLLDLNLDWLSQNWNRQLQHSMRKL